jgi:hypothetical protein
VSFLSVRNDDGGSLPVFIAGKGKSMECHYRGLPGEEGHIHIKILLKEAMVGYIAGEMCESCKT